MRQLEVRHILLFRILRDHCLFLTRRQIERVLTLSTNATTKQLQWLFKEQYLVRRYRLDSFVHFQTPLYYLGPVGWASSGKPKDDYKAYRLRVERYAERAMPHVLEVYDVFVKFILEGEVKRLIGAEHKLWQEAIDFGIIPDAWIQFSGGEAFIEVDRATEAPAVLRRKFLKYADFRNNGGYRRTFPGCGFKVLVFCPTEERIESLEKIVPSDDFWFCTLDEFVRERFAP